MQCTLAKKLDKLEGATIQCGPAVICPVKALRTMDANQDGIVTLSELSTYFAYVGREMNDEEFSALIRALAHQGPTALQADAAQPVIS